MPPPPIRILLLEKEGIFTTCIRVISENILFVLYMMFLDNFMDYYKRKFFSFFQATPESTGIKFPDFKQPGVFVRSQKVCYNLDLLHIIYPHRF